MYPSERGNNSTWTWSLQATLSLGDITPRQFLLALIECIHFENFNELIASWIDKLTILPNSSTQQLGIWKKPSATWRSISESISHFCVSAPWELRGGNLAMGRKLQRGNLSWQLTDPHRHRPSFFIAFLVLEKCSANSLVWVWKEETGFFVCLTSKFDSKIESVTNPEHGTIRAIPQSQRNTPAHQLRLEIYAQNDAFVTCTSGFKYGAILGIYLNLKFLGRFFGGVVAKKCSKSIMSHTRWGAFQCS